MRAIWVNIVKSGVISPPFPHILFVYKIQPVTMYFSMCWDDILVCLWAVSQKDFVSMLLIFRWVKLFQFVGCTISSEFCGKIFSLQRVIAAVIAKIIMNNNKYK